MALSVSSTGFSQARGWLGYMFIASVTVDCDIELGAEENDDERDPQPSHKDHDRTDRTIGLIVAGEVGGVPRKKVRSTEPE
jgi:hypothetical protein